MGQASKWRHVGRGRSRHGKLVPEHASPESLVEQGRVEISTVQVPAIDTCQRVMCWDRYHAPSLALRAPAGQRSHSAVRRMIGDRGRRAGPTAESIPHGIALPQPACHVPDAQGVDDLEGIEGEGRGKCLFVLEGARKRGLILQKSEDWNELTRAVQGAKRSGND